MVVGGRPSAVKGGKWDLQHVRRDDAPLKQVMFGTDYLYVSATENVADFNALHLNSVQIRANSRDNALRQFPALKA